MGGGPIYSIDVTTLKILSISTRRDASTSFKGSLSRIPARTRRAAFRRSSRILNSAKRVRFSVSAPPEMDRDDDDGVGFIAESHYLKSPTVAEQQAMALLQIPKREGREGSISSNVSDMDVPIYSSENLTTSPRRPIHSKKELDAKDENTNSHTSTTASATSKLDSGFNGKLIFAVIASALGSSFQHGYNTGVTNTPQKVLEKWISQVMGNRTGEIPQEGTATIVFSLAVAIFCVGGMIGGLATGFIADRFGRKGGLLLNNVLVFIAAICFGCSKAAASYELFIFARLIIGINSGLNAGLAPMYLAEISPINLRGAIGSVYQLVITISILVAQALGLKYALGTPDHWPVLFALTAVPAIFQILTLPLCPESPKYLLSSKGEMEAQKALGWLRGTLAVHEELDQMKAENDAVKLLPKVTVRELLTNRVLRIPLVICLFVMVAQQLSGINAVIFFSTQIFQQSGLKDDSATFATMGMGAINVMMTMVSLVLVEKAGRKTLLLIGFAGMAVDTLLLTIAMNFSESVPDLSYVCIVLVFIYIIMFASGPGSIPWFLVAELFNQSARPTAASLAVCTNWTANFLVGLAFLPIINAIGAYVFIIFVVLNCLFVLFIYKKVPETKNKTIEEISALFRQQSYQ